MRKVIRTVSFTIIIQSDVLGLYDYKYIQANMPLSAQKHRNEQLFVQLITLITRTN